MPNSLTEILRHCSKKVWLNTENLRQKLLFQIKNTKKRNEFSVFWPVFNTEKVLKQITEEIKIFLFACAVYTFPPKTNKKRKLLILESFFGSWKIFILRTNGSVFAFINSKVYQKFQLIAQQNFLLFKFLHNSYSKVIFLC